MPLSGMRMVTQFGAFFALSVIAACEVVTAMPGMQVASLMNVPPEKIVVVGRIEMVPPLREGEQVLKSGEEFRNAFVLYAGDRLRDFTVSPPESFEGSYLTTLGKEFFIKVDKGRTLYLSGGMFYTAYDPPYRAEPQTFSTPFQIELKADDEAVYIGTIQLVRDENNKLKSVFIRDDYEWADSRFKERFGTSKNLRKALAVPVVCPSGN